MAYDEMELDLLGDRRTALFVIISDTDDTFNFVVSMMIHCGDPISYTSINSTYWQSHFLGFGRIN